MIAFIGRLAPSDAVMADDAGIASKETLRLILFFESTLHSAGGKGWGQTAIT
jgi:hypothetical protein